MTYGQVITVAVIFLLTLVIIFAWVNAPAPKFMCGRCGLWFRPRAMKDIIYSGRRILCCPGCWMRIERTKDKKFQGVMR